MFLVLLLVVKILCFQTYILTCSSLVVDCILADRFTETLQPRRSQQLLAARLLLLLFLFLLLLRLAQQDRVHFVQSGELPRSALHRSGLSQFGPLVDGPTGELRRLWICTLLLQLPGLCIPLFCGGELLQKGFNFRNVLQCTLMRRSAGLSRLYLCK